jgi:hypothetical protein
MNDDNIEVEYYDDDAPEIDDATIDAALRALDEAQAEDEERMFLEADKMPCPECAGAGAMQGGSLGNACPRCGGQRVIEVPGSRVEPMMNWRALREPWSQYAKAKSDRQLPAAHDCAFCGGVGHSLHKGTQIDCPHCDGSGRMTRATRALPPVSSLAKVEWVQGLTERIRDNVRQLAAGGGNMPQLAPIAPEPEKTSLGGYSDEELDAIEERAIDAEEE